MTSSLSLQLLASSATFGPGSVAVTDPKPPTLSRGAHHPRKPGSRCLGQRHPGCPFRLCLSHACMMPPPLLQCRECGLSPLPSETTTHFILSGTSSTTHAVLRCSRPTASPTADARRGRLWSLLSQFSAGLLSGK